MYDDRISLRAVLYAVVIVLGCVTGLVLATLALGTWHGEMTQTFREVRLVNAQLHTIAALINDAREQGQVLDHRLLILQQRIEALEQRQADGRRH